MHILIEGICLVVTSALSSLVDWHREQVIAHHSISFIGENPPGDPEGAQSWVSLFVSWYFPSICVNATHENVDGHFYTECNI